MGSLALDTTTAGWLAGLDPSLGALPRALRACTSQDALSLHDIRWKPGRGCRFAFLDGDSFVAVAVNGDEWQRHDWLDDPDLPALAVAADADEIGRRLESVLGEAVEVAIAPVRYRPGSRGVLRYDVTTSSGTSTLFAKVLQPDSYRRIEALHAALAARPGIGSPVAEMVAWWPDLQVIVGRSVEGRSASSMLGDADLPADDRARLARDLGTLLARFHDLPVPAASRWSADQQVIALADTLGAVETADPAMGIRLGAVLDTLAATIPAPGPHVLGHGSFRAGQVVVTPEGRPVLLDTDEVTRGEAERDLGVALAHLAWQGIRQPHNRPTLLAAERELLAAYEGRAAGTVRPDALRWWLAAGLLQVAVRRYRRIEIGSWPLVGALAKAAEDLLDDEGGTGTHDMLDLAQMSVVLGRATGQKVEVERAELLGTAPKRRQVVRYDVRGLDDSPSSVIGKQFSRARSARLSYYHLRLLADGRFGDGPFRVPRPLGLSGEHRLLFYREDPGTHLDTRLDDAGVRQAAGWLAHLHTSELQLTRDLSLAQESESTKQWAELIARSHPRAASAARDLAAGWAAVAPASAVDVSVPIHKDFHAGHVLVGDSTCVIDLDEARMGDPAFDVAHFCTYLFELGAAHDLTKVFLDEYADLTGWLDKGTYAPFCAYTSLKIAKQAAAGSGPFRDDARPRRLAMVEAALARGTTWLAAARAATLGQVTA